MMSSFSRSVHCLPSCAQLSTTSLNTGSSSSSSHAASVKNLQPLCAPAWFIVSQHSSNVKSSHAFASAVPSHVSTSHEQPASWQTACPCCVRLEQAGCPVQYCPATFKSAGESTSIKLTQSSPFN